MIKLIATDMDGTWLRPDKSYDHQLFRKIFKLMQEQGIMFVVASSNQYENLRTRFPEVADQIYYIAENGGLIAEGPKVLQTTTLMPAEATEAYIIEQHYPYPVVWCGRKAAYILKREGKALYQEMHQFFEKLIPVDHFNLQQDRFFKTTVVMDEGGSAELAQKLSAAYSNLEFVAGSAFSVDISPVGMNKTVGLEYFREQYDIKPSEMVTFGDSGNDVKMLRYAGLSYATGTAMQSAKDAASGGVLGSSADSAVQKQILALLTK